MIDLDKTPDQIDKVDTILTKVGKLLSKHWKLLVFLLLSYGAYEFCMLVGREMEKEEELENMYQADEEWTFDIVQGDTIWFVDGKRWYE